MYKILQHANLEIIRDWNDQRYRLSTIPKYQFDSKALWELYMARCRVITLYHG